MLRYEGKREEINTAEIDTRMFDVDENAHERSAKQHAKRVQKNRNPNNTPSKRGNWFVGIMAAAVTAAVFSFYIHSGIELNTVNRETSAAMTRISELKRENARLSAELESMATLSRIEAFVEEHGLVREQILITTHINVNIEDTIIIAQDPEPDFFDRINARFNEVLEFLGFR
jgi:cell division protein FtsL